MLLLTYPVSLFDAGSFCSEGVLKDWLMRLVSPSRRSILTITDQSIASSALWLPSDYSSISRIDYTSAIL
jgi:hypothetical protein